MNGGGTAYRSVLLPHLEFIKEKRSQLKTWDFIAKELLTAQGISITARGVGQFLQRQAKSKPPIGFPRYARTICSDEKRILNDSDAFQLPEPATGSPVPAPQPKPKAFIPDNDNKL